MRTEDGYIINKCLDGNSAAFGFLVDKYKAAVYAFAYAELRNFHDAEDVTQEVFVKAYEKLHTLRRWDNFLAWLYSITSNLCKMFIRARSRRPDREFIADQESFEEPAIDPQRENPVMELLNDALDSLPETYRQTLTLYYLGGMSSMEIARFLGTSPTAIRHRLSRGRSKLKEGMTAMMSQTFEGQRLKASFTFRIVETVKHIKVNPMPRTAALPWGLSLATGIIFTVMILSPHLNILNLPAIPAGSPFSSQAKTLKTGEISVDILKTSEISVIASKQGDGDSGEKQQNAFMLAPQAEGDAWKKRADMPTKRSSLSTCVVDGQIYAVGGVAADDTTILANVEGYDPVKDRWEERAEMPTQRSDLSVSAVNGKIYAIGGTMDFRSGLSTVEIYDPVVDRWEAGADMPTARALLTSSVVNGKIYAIGGWGGNNALATVEEYDPVTDIWTKKKNMPTARYNLSADSVDGKIYAVGGFTGANYIPLSSVEEYDPGTDTWTKKKDMPVPRGFLSTSVVNRQIYAIGGAGKPNAALSTVEIYDPVMDRWKAGSDMPIARSLLSTSAVNGKIYAIGGWNNKGALSTVEEYDPEWAAVESRGKLPATWGEVKQR